MIDTDNDELTRQIAATSDDVMIDPGPSCWASYLINGDASGLGTTEIEACDHWCNTHWEGYRVVSTTDDEPYFSWSFSFYGGTALGGDLVEYVLHKIPETKS